MADGDLSQFVRTYVTENLTGELMFSWLLLVKERMKNSRNDGRPVTLESGRNNEMELGRLKITSSESQNYLLSYLFLINVFQHVKKHTSDCSTKV